MEDSFKLPKEAREEIEETGNKKKKEKEGKERKKEGKGN